jgi:hypothetical protein
MKAGLRWILVLPAAVAAYWLASLCVTLFNALNGIFYERWSDDWMEALQCGWGSFAFIYFGCKTAPSFKFRTAIALLVFMTIGIGLLAGLVIAKGVEMSTGQTVWRIVDAVVSVLGCLIGCGIIHEKEKEERPFENN